MFNFIKSLFTTASTDSSSAPAPAPAVAPAPAPADAPAPAPAVAPAPAPAEAEEGGLTAADLAALRKQGYAQRQKELNEKLAARKAAEDAEKRKKKEEEEEKNKKIKEKYTKEYFEEAAKTASYEGKKHIIVFLKTEDNKYGDDNIVTEIGEVARKTLANAGCRIGVKKGALYGHYILGGNGNSYTSLMYEGKCLVITLDGKNPLDIEARVYI